MPYYIDESPDELANDSSWADWRDVDGIFDNSNAPFEDPNALAGSTGVIIGDSDPFATDEEWLPGKLRVASPPSCRRAPTTPQLEDLLPSHDEDDVGLVVDERGRTIGTLLSPTFHTASLPNRLSVDIPDSTLVQPRTRYPDFQLPAPEREEAVAVRELLELYPPTQEDDFVEFELDQFAIYRHSLADINAPHCQQRYPFEMRPLQTLSIKGAHLILYVDGVLSYGDTKFFVRGIAFEDLPLGNYGVAESTVGDQVWIRSKRNQRAALRNIYYKLKSPAKEYARYHKGFVWIADLGKHVIDYLTAAGEKKRRVEFRHFKSHFHRWLTQTHGRKPAFLSWLRQFGQTDFRVAINAYNDFIYKEAHGVLGARNADFHTFWKEIRYYTAYKPYGAIRSEKIVTPSAGQSPEVEDIGLESAKAGDKKRHNASPPFTVVTPYIHDCFGHLPFGHLLEAVTPSDRTERLRNALIEKQHLQPDKHVHESPKHLDSAKAARAKGLRRAVRIGDVISTPRDSGTDAKWARDVATGFDDVDRWFGLVQRVHTSKVGHRSFDVIWIYRPVDTICGQMKYPWNNELFLSDHCSCQDGHEKIKESEVLEIHDIQWGGSSTSTNFFCRQTYMHVEHRWITLKAEHKVCSHRTPLAVNPDNYRVGETILVLLNVRGLRLEPCELITAPTEPGVKIQVRKLLRRIEVAPASAARPNELVYSDEIKSVLLSNIYGRCIIRHYAPGKTIGTPYDRDGVGNAFYITTFLRDIDGVKTCVPFSDERPFPKTFRQGMDPQEKFRKLQGFDLFCGGGNFGRGLEETGAIEMRWANDINMRAVHTYMANLHDPRRVNPFPGSIDDLSRMALEGRFADNVPLIGDVDFVSGGSPCPGFSRLTVDKSTPEQRKNQSLVAAFASFIDTYRPKYGLLENVVEIVQTHKARDEDVFCQLICAIVGMGYQTHFFLLDAWTFGSPQSRSRIFLAFAAPGLRLPEVPMQSHLPMAMRSRSLGLLSNGEPMLKKTFMPTAFKSVTAREALADLPDIIDAKADCCIPFPDHRQSIGVTRKARPQFSTIPTRPWGLDMSTAYKDGKGVMTEAERRLYPEGSRSGVASKAFGRLHPNKLIGTITTTPSPSDKYGRPVLHWEQNRILTVMEARRAQGFRDHEVILGTPAEQWKTVGNSVAREVSIALGLSFREAWLSSLTKGDEKLPLPRHVVQQPTMESTKPAISQQQEVKGELSLVYDEGDDRTADILDDDRWGIAEQRYPTPREILTPRRTTRPSVSINGTTSYDPHDKFIFGPEAPTQHEIVPEGADLVTNWRGQRSVDETYAPSDYESEPPSSPHADSWTPEPSASRGMTNTPATTVTGESRAGSAVSSRKRQLPNSIIVELFAGKMVKTGADKRARFGE
ncbi:hypothetical protein ACHAQA_007775 [Verticillium albo-atrum]